MALQRVSGFLGHGGTLLHFSAAWRFGPDRDDLCTELQRYYWLLAVSSAPPLQLNAAYRRWMLVQRQLFSGTTFDPNKTWGS